MRKLKSFTTVVRCSAVNSNSRLTLVFELKRFYNQKENLLNFGAYDRF
jgi:hypothetical protein